MNPDNSETYINHPTWGLLYRICMIDENQDLFTTLYAQRLFFLVANDVKAIKFQPIGRTEARMLLENRLRTLRRTGQSQEYDQLPECFPTHLPMITSSLNERITTIRASLPPSVRLIAVSKQVPAEVIRCAYAAGIRDFGENRIQEAASKQTELHDLPDITWHFIGHLQSNKAKKAIELFDWIHSVDNLKLAQRLNQLAQELGVSPQVCLQVKILPDPNKSGWNVPELLADLTALNQCKSLQIQGLMTIPPFGLPGTEILNVFNSTYELAKEIQEQNWSDLKMQQLSMGMSGDYELAVQAGATMVRLGTVLFGDRT